MGRFPAVVNNVDGTVASIVVELITVTGVRGVVPLRAVEAAVKFVPVIVIVTAPELPAGAPGGQIPFDAAIVGVPALTVKVTLIVTLLFDAFVDETTTVPLYGVIDGARPVASAVIVKVSGNPSNAILPVGDAFSHVPPETATDAVSAFPLVATTTVDDCTVEPLPVV
jgi:hypothetical protein